MNLKNPIVISCLFMTEEEETLEALDLNIDVEGELRPVIFYTVDNVSPYFDKGKLVANISSGGADYVTNISVEEAVKLINAHLQ